jgi:hypothetical protein
MTDDLNSKLAGPLALDKSAFERDARIPEKNDGKVVNEPEWVASVEANKAKIFAHQDAFFDELRKRGD